jgi:putative DNA primase/helicase
MRAIAECTAALAELHAQIFGFRLPNGPNAARDKAVEADNKDRSQFTAFTDDQVIEIARRSTNGERFWRLYNGEWQSTYSSQSQADLALCAMLSFWTEGDADRIDRLFRRSGLMRGKWDRRDYRERTIQRAIDNASQNYQTHADVQCASLSVQSESLM